MAWSSCRYRLAPAADRRCCGDEGTSVAVWSVDTDSGPAGIAPLRSIDGYWTGMYTYIMERTQIYLTRDQAGALDREAKRTGTTRSHLIREAIAAQYGATKDVRRVERVLRETAGLWHGRNGSGGEYVEQLRTGHRLSELYRKDVTGPSER